MPIIKIDIAEILKTFFDTLCKLAKEKPWYIAIFLVLLAILVWLAIKAFECIMNIWDDHLDRKDGRQPKHPKSQPIDVPWVEEPPMLIERDSTKSHPIDAPGVEVPPTLIEGGSPQPWLQLLSEGEPSQDITPDNVKDALTRAPRSRQLFGEFLYERDKAYWGARTGVGKTTLAFQCATDLAMGKHSVAFGNTNAPIPQLVYYFDFEVGVSDMLGKQGGLLQQCPSGSIVYKDYVGKFTAGDVEYIGTLLAIIAKSLWENKRDTTIFIDNITALCGESDNCKKALREGIDKLVENALQIIGINVTFVCVSHITDGDDFMPLKRENLRGNKTQITWATSVLLFGKTRTGGRYIKQLKNRKGYNPNEDWVVTTRLEGKDEGTSHWVAEEWDYECKVIALKPKQNKTETAAPTPNSPQLDSASPDSEEENGTKASYSREKIELTEEQLVRCREVYEDAISSGKGKTAALKETAGEVLGDEGKYKTVERRLGL